MEIRPITFRQASDYINQNHRHHKATVGCKYCIGLYDGENLIGCAVCGRPVSRYLDDGLTCEINRVCTDGTRNAYVIRSVLPSGQGDGIQADNYIHFGI